MGPSDYIPFYQPVCDNRGRKLARVRGLCAADLDWLWQAHEDDAESLYAAWQNDPANGFGQAIILAARNAPELVKSVIAIASDEPDMDAGREGAGRLPFGVRTATLAKIVSMTFGSEGGLEAAMEARRRTQDEDDEDRPQPKKTDASPVARRMLTVRDTVSFLAEHGRREAGRWPVGRIFLEAEIVRKRRERTQANDAVLMQKTVGSLIDEKIGRDFSKWIKELAGDGD